MVSCSARSQVSFAPALSTSTLLKKLTAGDLPVPADIARGLLGYAYRLRASAMHEDAIQPDSADNSAASTRGLTYCQAVPWIKPLLATIEQGNNNFSGIQDIERQRTIQN